MLKVQTQHFIRFLHSMCTSEQVAILLGAAMMVN